MQNSFFDKKTEGDIDARVERLLRDIGDPAPPLRLEFVREALKLDRGYYSLSDPSLLQETVHRMSVAGVQIVKRPMLLLDAVRKRELKALWSPDKKRILIDEKLPKLKHRWAEAHEIGHSLVPWHENMLHGDQARTLRYSCEVRVEAEANFAAGRLLFLRDAFRERLLSGPINYERILELSKEFDNTQTSTLWRAIECLDVAAFGVVSQHPRRRLKPEKPKARYLVGSRKFLEQFELEEDAAFALLGQYCKGQKGPIGKGEVVIQDRNGDKHVFAAETFFNHHEALTLAIHKAPVGVSVISP